MDFTLQRYERLLRCILESGYAILPYQDYLKKKIPEKTVIMRHDVDQKENALSMAKIEKQFGAFCFFYFSFYFFFFLFFVFGFNWFW